MACSWSCQSLIIAKSEEKSENKALKVKNQMMKGFVSHSAEGAFPPEGDRSP